MQVPPVHSPRPAGRAESPTTDHQNGGDARVNTPPAITYEVDPDFLEHARREACERPELPWDD